MTEIITFGCRLNAYESEVIRAHAAGLAETPLPLVITPHAPRAEEMHGFIWRAHQFR